VDDDRRKRDELGSAPTTPAPPGPSPSLAAGSGRSPDSTLDMTGNPRPIGSDSTVAMPASGDSEPGPGAAIGRFIVRARLGAGGMGVVYAGEDADLKRPVAIKLVRGDAEHPAYRDRLLREAQAMARLEHPNVVRVYEVGTAGGRTFVAMELVEGTTLTKWLAAPRPWSDVLAMFLQAGEGLAAAHRAGLVHRDFKPDNVLVDRSGRARVADFGLARIEAHAGAQLTRTGAVMGTPGYMAPEQQLGDPQIDGRADQYSFCVALREALGGRPLDEARWRLVPESVRTAISRGLQYDPDERFAAIDELLALLRGTSTVPGSPIALRASSARAREPRWLIALAAVGVLGAAAAVVAYVSTHRGGDEAAIAQTPSPVRAPDDAAIPSDNLAATVRDAGVATKRPADVAVGGARGSAAVARGGAAVTQGSAVASAQGSGAVGIVAQGSGAVGITQGPAGLHVVAPHTKGWPQAKPGAPGHLEIVRGAIRDLGYDGVDVGAFDRAPDDAKKKLDAEIASASDAAIQIGKIKLGMLERRRGNCAAATEQWGADPNKLLKPNSTDENNLWLARAHLGNALCFLAQGDGDHAWDSATRGWVHGNRDEANLVMAFSAYEQRKMDMALGLLMTAQRSQDARVQAALKKWFDGLGLSIE
jgi:predicted Ser/Thr protein kinase